MINLYKGQHYNSEYAKRAELLAPAGSYGTMVAAVTAGADAVYLGGSMFGARAYANNLDTESLKRALDFVHLHNRKLYLTVNTLLKENELKKELYAYLQPLYEYGLDAVIVQDMGVFQFVREHFPELPIHASTQMTITGPHAAGLLKSLGAERIVTARELSLDEIKAIHETEGLEDLEIESFIHGALCYCYSGQCLFSSIAGGRSGNRGRCAQPCRLPYQAFHEGRSISRKNEPYLLSPKDLCSIEILPAILEAGVYSLKIEGRMKKPEYTAGVVSVYRKYLDYYLTYGKEGYQVSREDRQILHDLYNRGGFTKGYYVEENGRNMMFLEGREGESAVRNAALFQAVGEAFLNTEPKLPITGKALIEAGREAELTLSDETFSVSVTGEVIQMAQKQPMTEEKIRKQIEKLGNTVFVMENLEVTTDGNSFISITALNELRRAAVEKLEQKHLRPYRRTAWKELKKAVSLLPPTSQSVPGKYEINVYVEKKELADTAAQFAEVSAVYLDAAEFSAEDVASLTAAYPEKGFYYVLPHVLRGETLKWLEREYESLLQTRLAGFVVKNMDELAFLQNKSCRLPVRYDFTMYSFNTESIAFLEEKGMAERITMPVELNARELQTIVNEKSELFVYGYLPMMVTKQCTMKNTRKCTHIPTLLSITDRYQNEFPVKNLCKFCYNRIYNCKPLSLLSVKKEVDCIAPSAIRLDFTIESPKEAREILTKFIAAYKQDVAFDQESFDFTRGHFKRGIE